jgi:hypothetical protein
MGGLVYLAIRFFLYGEKAASAIASEEPVWAAWIQEHFPMPPTAE